MSSTTPPHSPISNKSGEKILEIANDAVRETREAMLGTQIVGHTMLDKCRVIVICDL